MSAYNNKDIFLKIDGIEGESKDSKHDKWIDVRGSLLPRDRRQAGGRLQVQCRYG